MMCAYCGIANIPGSARCAGCGAHGTAPPAAAVAASPSPSLYEQIGRAVVEREHGDALRTLARLGEREEASTRANTTARIAKVLFCLFLLWTFPGPVMGLLGFALMFFLWIYLPYRILKSVFGWLVE